MIPYVDIHTHHHVISDNIVQIVNSLHNKEIVAKNSSVGIHPWEVGKIDLDISLKEINELLKDPRILALGEIGLDRAIETPLDQQIEIFIKQLHLAKSFILPVVIHSVKTINEIVKLKKEEDTGTPWIIHGIDCNEKEVEQLITQGFYLSFGPGILRTGAKVRKSILNVPIDRMFFETDDQVIVDIKSIYREVAKILQMDLELLKEQVFTNFKEIFQNA